jgi:hypothetical protein
MGSGYVGNKNPLANGYNPTYNQSEFFSPINSECGDEYRGNGVALSRGFQTYLPGPFHFEDAYGQVGVAGYMPAPVVQISLAFRGDVPLKEAPKFSQGKPWQRGAIYTGADNA